MKKIFFLIVLVISLQSCVTPLYVPNTTNTPSLINKNDIELGGYVGSNAYGIQSAYAISDNIGIMLNGSFAQNHSDSSNTYREHRFIELGVGYSTQLNNNTGAEDKGIYFTGYGGYGMGTAEGLATSTNIFNGNTFNNISAGNYYRIFAQPSIGWFGDYTEFLFAIRANYVQFTSLQNYIGADWYDAIDQDGFDYNIFYEPTLTLRTGGEKIKGVIQLGTSIGHIPNNKTAFKGRPLIFIIGIHFNL